MPYYLLLSLLFELPLIGWLNGQNKTVFQGGQVFLVKLTETGISSKIPIGSDGKLTYETASNSYTVSWIKKDGKLQRMKLKFIGKREDVNLFGEAAGKQYAIDASNLNTQGIFFALIVDLKTNKVTDQGILITYLKRK